VHRLRATRRASGGTTPGTRSLGSSRRARFATRPHKGVERVPNASRIIETASSGALAGEQTPEPSVRRHEPLATPPADPAGLATRSPLEQQCSWRRPRRQLAAGGDAGTFFTIPHRRRGTAVTIFVDARARVVVLRRVCIGARSARVPQHLLCPRASNVGPTPSRRGKTDVRARARRKLLRTSSVDGTNARACVVRRFTSGALEEPVPGSLHATGELRTRGCSRTGWRKSRFTVDPDTRRTTPPTADATDHAIHGGRDIRSLLLLVRKGQPSDLHSRRSLTVVSQSSGCVEPKSTASSATAETECR
jgi:hypothetical protein